MNECACDKCLVHFAIDGRIARFFNEHCFMPVASELAVSFNHVNCRVHASRGARRWRNNCNWRISVAIYRDCWRCVRQRIKQHYRVENNTDVYDQLSSKPTGLTELMKTDARQNQNDIITIILTLRLTLEDIYAICDYPVHLMHVKQHWTAAGPHTKIWDPESVCGLLLSIHLPSPSSPKGDTHFK